MKNAVIKNLYESFSYSAKNIDTKAADKEVEESLNEQIWSSYPGDNYLNNKKNIIDSVNKFITKYNLNDVSIDNIVYRPDLDTALINIVFTPQIREYAPSIIDDFCKDIVKELRNKSKEKLLYRKYIHDSNTFLPAIELVRSFDESLKEDYNSDLETERKIQKYLDDHNLWGEVSVQDGTVYVEIHWGDWKHDHWYCQDLMSELGYVLVGKEVTEEDGSDTFSAIHTYEKMGVTNESLSLKEGLNYDDLTEILYWCEKMCDKVGWWSSSDPAGLFLDRLFPYLNETQIQYAISDIKDDANNDDINESLSLKEDVNARWTEALLLKLLRKEIQETAENFPWDEGSRFKINEVSSYPDRLRVLASCENPKVFEKDAVKALEDCMINALTDCGIELSRDSVTVRDLRDVGSIRGDFCITVRF